MEDRSRDGEGDAVLEEVVGYECSFVEECGLWDGKKIGEAGSGDLETECYVVGVDAAVMQAEYLGFLSDNGCRSCRIESRIFGRLVRS